MLRRWSLGVLTLALAACGPAVSSGEPEAASAGLAPTFPAAQASDPEVNPSSIEQTSTTTAGQPDAPPPTVATATSAPGSPEAVISDPAGDVTETALDPPPWSDLLGATLVRHPDGYELRVELGGGTAPTGSGDPGRTMNLASFYDVDEDGSIDFEVWANLADGGWGGSWFDDDAGRAAYVEESGVAVTVEGAEVVLRFPLTHLGAAERFRWALASEYGPQPTLGTELAARDDAPDADAPADFPQ